MSKPPIIYYQGPVRGFNPNNPPLRTNNILNNLSYVDSLPFDGLAIDVPASWDVMKGRNLDYEQNYAKWLRPLQGKLKNVTENYILAQIDKPADPFDDWSSTISNWRKMARAAKEFGLKGIFFDNEEYGKRMLNYPNDVNYASRYSVEQYQQQMRLRGRQIMQAVHDEAPGLDVLITNGPHFSVKDRPGTVRPVSSSEYTRYELHAPLFMGMVEGAMPDTIIDGGQHFQYRSAEDFRASYEWRKFGIKEDGSQFMYGNLKNRWSGDVDISFGVFNQPYDRLNARLGDHTPQTTYTAVKNALNYADNAIWVYEEVTNAMNPSLADKNWLNAIRRARNDASGNRPNTSTPPRETGTNNSPPPTPPQNNNPAPPQNNNSSRGNLTGTNGNDRLFGTSKSEVFKTFNGNDEVKAGSGNDIVIGGSGRDVFFGQDGKDRLYGKTGNDRLFGGNDNDLLEGDSNNDELFGQAGNDTIVGGYGIDTLIGGSGNDFFKINRNKGRDVVADFQDNRDRFILADGLSFGSLSFRQSNGNTYISDKNSGQDLIFVANTNPGQINANDFIRG